LIFSAKFTKENEATDFFDFFNVCTAVAANESCHISTEQENWKTELELTNCDLLGFTFTITDKMCY